MSSYSVALTQKKLEFKRLKQILTCINSAVLSKNHLIKQDENYGLLEIKDSVVVSCDEKIIRPKL